MAGNLELFNHFVVLQDYLTTPDLLSRIYNTSIHLYQALLRVAAPFHPKARLAVDGRRNWAEQVKTKLAGNRAPIAWFHAASLGEFEQGRPVMEAFRLRYPDHKILLTFFSPSGYEVRKQYPGADYILYLPVDTPANARHFVELTRPALAFFIKYEFWYNYLRELSVRKIPVISFSAVFRPEQLFFKPYGRITDFYRQFLRFFDRILVQNEESVYLLKSIGIHQVVESGDTRFDRVYQVAAAKKDLPLIRAFKNNRPVLVVGSAWQADMEILIPFLNGFEQPLNVIIAPHEIHSEEIEGWRRRLHKPSIRYSEAGATAPEKSPSPSYLFIDNIGMLSSLYQYGEFAYIGGAFGKGLHNILEAATFGMPLFFGPNYHKFAEAVDLVKVGAAFPVRSSEAFAAAFDRLYRDESARALAAGVSREYVRRNIGATDKVMKVVEEIISCRTA